MRKSLVQELATLRRQEKQRRGWIAKEFRTMRKMVLLADEIGQRLVKAGVFTRDEWEWAKRPLITDCMPDFSVSAYALAENGAVTFPKVKGTPVLAAVARALGVRLAKDYVGAPAVVESGGKRFARIVVWLRPTEALPDQEDGMFEELRAANVRVRYDKFVPMPPDGGPVVIGRSSSAGSKVTVCQLEEVQPPPRLAIVCRQEPAPTH